MTYTTWLLYIPFSKFESIFKKPFRRLSLYSPFLKSSESITMPCNFSALYFATEAPIICYP